MIRTIYGECTDSVGIMLAGQFSYNTGYPVTGPFSAMGFIKDTNILGQAIFNDYTGANMEIHLFAPGCFTRSVISSVYKFVFNFKKCKRLTAKPSTRNKDLYQLLERIGFEYEFTQKDYYQDNDGAILDALVYKLTRDNVPDWVKLT